LADRHARFKPRNLVAGVSLDEVGKVKLSQKPASSRAMAHIEFLSK
jgi:hypothetical protein